MGVDSNSWKSGEVAQQRKTSLPQQTGNQKIDTWEKDLGKPQGTRNFRLLQQKMRLAHEENEAQNENDDFQHRSSVVKIFINVSTHRPMSLKMPNSVSSLFCMPAVDCWL